MRQNINTYNLLKEYCRKKIFGYAYLVLFLIFFIGFKISYSQWQPDVRLTNNPASSQTCYGNSWAVAANGNIVHVVWWDNRDGNYEIYYKRSTDGGLNWETGIRLTNSIGISALPSIKLSGMYVHVVWEDDRDGNREIYYKRSTNGGISWGADTRMTNDPYASYSPSLSVCGPFVHIVWPDTRNGPYSYSEIYHKRSTNNGANWSTDIRLTNDSFESVYPSISASGCNVHVVWEDLRHGINDGNWEIYYKRSTNGGLSWGVDTRLTNDIAISVLPSISAIGPKVHVVWQDTRDGNDEIYYKHSTDVGTIWNSDTRLTNNIYISEYPNVIGNGQNVHVVWTDNRINNLEKTYYKRSTDVGLSWQVDTILSWFPGIQFNPTIGVSGTSVHVVWTDTREQNYEIFYKRNPTGNLLPTYTISGRVTFKDNGQPVNQGFVKALHYDTLTHNIIRVDSTIILPGGYYTLPRVPQDSTDIMYYQNDEEGLEFVPTYYISTINWQEANTIYPTQNLTDIDGQVYRIINDSSSNLHIRGTCYTQSNQPTNTLEDVIIYAKIGNDFKNYGISNGNGLYTATKLPSGSYTLLAYRMGYEHLTRNVTISNNSLDTINFYFSSPIGIKQLNETVPMQISLYQNYPNPFNPITKIIFDVPVFHGLLDNGKNDLFTELKIYNVLCKEVAVLIYEQLQPGKYEITWNANDYPSGLYFCTLRIGNFTQTKKMILLK